MNVHFVWLYCQIAFVLQLPSHVSETLCLVCFGVPESEGDERVGVVDGGKRREVVAVDEEEGTASDWVAAC